MFNFIYRLISLGSYVAFPILAFVLWEGGRFVGWFFSLLVMVLGLMFIWMRFIEPSRLRVKHIQVPGSPVQARIALVSDLHLGAYKSEQYLQRVIRALQDVCPDYVFFLGDYVMGAKNSDLLKLLKPLQNLKIRSFAVWGNHDYGQRDDLAGIFADFGIQVLHNQQENMGGWTLVGLGSDRHHDDRVEILQEFTGPAIILAHEPTTALKIQGSYLIFSGHTHGGQIRLPFLTKIVLKLNYGGFDHGWLQGSYGRLFISSGLGETALPLRFRIPPQLDILDLTT